MGQRVFEGREHRYCYFFSVSLSPSLVLRIFDPHAAFHVQCFHQFVGIAVCKFHVTPQSALSLNFNIISQNICHHHLHDPCPKRRSFLTKKKPRPKSRGLSVTTCPSWIAAVVMDDQNKLSTCCAGRAFMSAAL